MRILPQIARFTSAYLPSLKFWFRVVFLVCGAILIYRAEQERIVRDAQEEADYQAFLENLAKDNEEFNRRSDERMTSIYRSLNTIFSYAGLAPIGDD